LYTKKIISLYIHTVFIFFILSLQSIFYKILCKPPSYTTEALKRGRKRGSRNLKTIERERLAQLQTQENGNESNEEKKICQDKFYFYFFLYKSTDFAHF
jgi:hypothetical protein